MLKYSYKALSSDGKKHQGTLVATSDDDFNKVLAEKQLRVYWFKTTGKSEAGKLTKLDINLVLAFCRQLASMLNAGLPLLKSLEMLYERTEKPKLKNVLAALFEAVQKGNSLAEAMGTLGTVFPVLLVSMIKSGEMSGKLEETLIRMAEYYDKEKKQKGQIKSATAYPKIVLVICFVVVGVLLTTIMPKMIGMVSPDKLPMPTKILLGIKDFFGKNYFVIICVVFGIIIALPILKKIEAVNLFLAKMKTKLPIVGKLNKMVYTSRFASSLSTLCSSGVHLLDALTMVSEMMENAFIQNQLESAIEAIRRGESISVALQGIESFDPLLMTMIFVGEESGSLDEILSQTAAYFEDESDTAVKGLTSMINPILMLFMAVVIGFVMISILLPMFAMYDSVG
ncbi:MAG: type II secretion system F family protein [Clostridia bacterium]